MEAKWIERVSTNQVLFDWWANESFGWVLQELEPFIDVNKLSIVKKNVKPILQQEENESRRLWKEVTAGLKFNNIDRATNAKASLEQRQRDEAKDRKDNNVRWETKVCFDRWPVWTGLI